MDFSIIFFGKKLNELSYKDMQDFFSEEKIENDQIEFKSINSKGNIEDKIDALIENVCAFLNSEGGIIIWGAPEGTKKQGQEERYSGALTPHTQLIEKDKFINKISSRIIPLPYGINIKPLESDEKFIYVLEVQKSDYSPHQTNNKYFMRLDGQTRHAPHHFIEALFKKIKFPNIEAYVGIDWIKVRPNINVHGRRGKFYELSLSFFVFNWSHYQNEELVYLKIDIFDAIFSEYSNNGLNLQYVDSNCYEDFNLKQILSHGDPALHVDNIFIHEDDLIRNGLKSDILITFGGKYSPVKYCFYSLDLNNIDESDYNKSLIVVYSNSLYKNLDTSGEVNKAQLLDSFKIK